MPLTIAQAKALKALKLKALQRAKRVRNPARKNTGFTSSRYSGLRTPGTIIKSLASRMRPKQTRQTSAYIKSLLNPFVFKGAPIPDGNNASFACIDMVGVSNISFTFLAERYESISFEIKTFPILPQLAGLFPPQSGGIITVDNVPYAQSLLSDPTSTTFGGAYIPLCIPNAFKTPSTAYRKLGLFKDDPWNASKARCASFGYRIIYTGPVMSCAGSITVTPNNIAITKYRANATSGAFLAVGADGNPGITTELAQNTAEKGCSSYSMEVNSITNASYKLSRTFRPEMSIYVLPKRNQGVNLPSALFPCSTPLFANVASSADAANLYNVFRNNSVSAVTSDDNVCGGIIWVDDSWESYSIFFNNVNTSGSFRIEAIACFELTLKNGSPFMDLSMKSSPNNPKELNDAKNIVKDDPSAKTEAEMPGAFPA